jgi:transcription elongation factor GreB
MSRAFVKEEDGDRLTPEEFGIPPLEGPVLLTPAGFRRLEAELAEARGEVARLREAATPEDRLTLAHALRRLRMAEQQRAAARVVHPPATSGQADTVSFGARVTVEDETGREQRYTIVGATEADPARGRISHRSPLAAALLGHRVGDEVTWRRPAGEVTLVITEIETSAA